MPPDIDNEEARAELHQSIVAVFCKVLNGSRLPPMTVMSVAASALGSIYKDVADQHCCDNPCPCGWQPNPRADVAALQAALAAKAQTMPPPDLRVIQAAGRA